MKKIIYLILLFIIAEQLSAQKEITLNGIHTLYNKNRKISKVAYFKNNQVMFGVNLTYDDSSQIVQQISTYDNGKFSQTIFDRDTFEIEKQRIEHENVKQKEVIKEEKDKNFLFLIISLSIGLFLLISIISFLNIRKQKQKIELQNNLINQQKVHLEHQKTEILDSINYSKRIQSAILPDLLEIKSNLNEVFVFYKPKDIVSGDFYYFNKTNDGNFIAVADCTGHGVPGAFMSLIGSKELKIANSQSNSPAQILKILNNGVKETLKQNQIGGTKDGMDIALIKINNNKIIYSGANRSLWIIEKNSDSITEIKATKTAIAGHTVDNKEFEEHEVILNKGDTLYLSSDGYADQFGGAKQKKMTTKRFKDLLLSIKSKSMIEQQTAIENYFKKWQGDIEQVDDILVIGIRI